MSATSTKILTTGPSLQTMGTKIEKTIYAKRKGLTQKQLGEILAMEINHHLRNNPTVVFVKVGEPKKNEDQSTTFPIYFKPAI